jgi:Hemopexin
MSDYVNYFFSGNEYIRVHRADTGPGSPPLDPGYPTADNIKAWNWPKGFGENGIDAALYSGSKCFFFKGSYYISVTRNGTEGPGTQDYTSPRPITDWEWKDGFGQEGIDAALWSGGVTYFFKGQSYIRVTRTSDSDLGTTDEGYPQPLTNWKFPGTFGQNGIKGALYSGSVCYFFDGPQYIRVSRGLEGAGFCDAGYPRNIKDVWGWGDFGVNGIDAALYSGGPLVTQPVPLSNGNVNYYLQDGGNNLRGVQVTIDFDEEFVSSLTGGFSFQLNCYGPAAETTGAATLQQFLISDLSGAVEVVAWAEIWAQVPLGPNKTDTSIYTTPYNDFLTLATAETIPQGYQFIFELTYGDGDVVTGCIFTVKDNQSGNVPGGTTINPSPTQITLGLTEQQFAPIVAFTLNIGGWGNKAYTTIAPGSAGTITYKATNSLTATTYVPTDTAWPAQTEENANILFGPLPTTSHTSLTHGFRSDPPPTPGPGNAA